MKEYFDDYSYIPQLWITMKSVFTDAEVIMQLNYFKKIYQENLIRLAMLRHC